METLIILLKCLCEMPNNRLLLATSSKKVVELLAIFTYINVTKLGYYYYYYYFYLIVHEVETMTIIDGSIEIIWKYQPIKL